MSTSSCACRTNVSSSVGLDPLGDDERARAVGVRDDGDEHGLRVAVARGGADDGPVDLHEVHRELAAASPGRSCPTPTSSSAMLEPERPAAASRPRSPARAWRRHRSVTSSTTRSGSSPAARTARTRRSPSSASRSSVWGWTFRNSRAPSGSSCARARAAERQMLSRSCARPTFSATANASSGTVEAVVLARTRQRLEAEDRRPRAAGRIGWKAISHVAARRAATAARGPCPA